MIVRFIKGRWNAARIHEDVTSTNTVQLHILFATEYYYWIERRGNICWSLWYGLEDDIWWKRILLLNCTCNIPILQRLPLRPVALSKITESSRYILRSIKNEVEWCVLNWRRQCLRSILIVLENITTTKTVAIFRRTLLQYKILEYTLKVNMMDLLIKVVLCVVN